MNRFLPYCDAKRLSMSCALFSQSERSTSDMLSSRPFIQWNGVANSFSITVKKPSFVGSNEGVGDGEGEGEEEMNRLGLESSNDRILNRNALIWYSYAAKSGPLLPLPSSSPLSLFSLSPVPVRNRGYIKFFQKSLKWKQKINMLDQIVEMRRIGRKGDLTRR